MRQNEREYGERNTKMSYVRHEIENDKRPDDL